MDEKDYKENGETPQNEGEKKPSPQEEPSPEKKDEGKKPKKNIYDQYRYWGSDNGSGGHGGGNNNKGSARRNRLALAALILLIISFAYVFMTDTSAVQRTETSYSAFLAYAESGSVARATIVENQVINYTLSNGAEGTCRIPYYDMSLIDTLKEYGIDVSGAVQPTPFWYILIQLLPWVIFIVMIVMIMRQTGAAGGNRMMSSFGKSHAQMYGKNDKKVTFADVAGQKEAKYELQEVVDFLKHPERFVKIGAKIPKGVLLVGPPGTGKTLLARAVAGEAGVSFLHTSGSDFVEMFVGMGAARVRDLFSEARKNAPCIIFIDELDAVGRARGSGLGGGHDEREQTLNQMLVEMDGFSTDPGVIVMAATNRPDVLDPALLRPGRFDRRVPVELPDLTGREEILKVHAKKVKTDPSIDYNVIARMASGASGAELANIVNEAALRAVREGRNSVSQRDMEESIEVVFAGYQKKNAILTPKEKLTVSYHEVGHALVAALQTNSAPVQKITIIPRTNGALGYTMQVEEGNHYLYTKEELENRIATLTGGRAAEEIAFNTISTGASNDIEQATRVARAMITQYGMSDDFDMVAMESINNKYLGQDASLACSDDTAALIDEKVVELVKKQHNKAKQLLLDHKKDLDRIAKYLYEKETITGEEFMDILNHPESEETPAIA